MEGFQYAGRGTTESPFVLTWIPGDPGNPYTWNRRYKWSIAAVAAIASFVTSVASSAFSGPSGLPRIRASRANQVS